MLDTIEELLFRDINQIMSHMIMYESTRINYKRLIYELKNYGKLKEPNRYIKHEFDYNKEVPEPFIVLEYSNDNGILKLQVDHNNAYIYHSKSPLFYPEHDLCKHLGIKEPYFSDEQLRLIREFCYYR